MIREKKKTMIKMRIKVDIKIKLNQILRDETLQDFIVLPTDLFRRCVISSSSVIYLPTSLPTDYVRRLSLRRWFPILSLYRSEKQKNHLPMVLQTKFAHQKKVSRLKYTDGFYSVGDIVIDRRIQTVGKFVGECLKYRPNISICKFIGKCGSYCQMPMDSVRR
jgi:hypothetical protein